MSSFNLTISNFNKHETFGIFCYENQHAIFQIICELGNQY